MLIYIATVAGGWHADCAVRGWRQEVHWWAMPWCDQRHQHLPLGS